MPTKEEIAKVKKALEAGPEWSFCPYLDKDCNIKCECMIKPSFSDAHASWNWHCNYPSKNRFTRMELEIVENDEVW